VVRPTSVYVHVSRLTLDMTLGTHLRERQLHLEEEYFSSGEEGE